jgi:signal transduction histidine kinase
MQVLGNLLSNALKFTEQGSITIYIHYDKECSQLTIKVSDTGSGIDPTILSRLFTKFATKSSYKGTGLGLYISKSITQAHGGKIWAENNDENRKGATIAFTLPIK